MPPAAATCSSTTAPTCLCDASVRERLGWSDEDALRLQQENLDVINAVIADQPDDLVINTHVCRGNFHSTWLSSGGYAPVAAKLFGEENVDAYYLEFDDDRSGDFAPLAEVSGDKKVVLGLITSSPTLRIRTPSRPASRKPPSTFRSTACACPPSAASPPPGRQQAHRRPAVGQDRTRPIHRQGRVGRVNTARHPQSAIRKGYPSCSADSPLFVCRRF